MTDDNLLTADIPEKFKDAKTGAVRMDAFVQSYKALEQKLSHMHDALPRVPDTPEEYCVACENGVLAADSEVNARLHAKGLTQEQVQEVYNIAEEKMIPLIQEMAADYRADREVEKLMGHFGGAQAWKEVSRQLLAFGRKNLPSDVLDNLTSSYEGVLALHRMMQGKEPSLQRGKTQATNGMDENKLTSMMRDPKYWQQKDPAFVAQVTQGFKDLYGA